jgi:hypothetical protein
MRKMMRIFVAGAVLAAVPTKPVLAVDSPSPMPKVAADQNQRVCEDIIVTGSRLAAKRFCGTRAEWEAKRKADRDVIDDAQRHANDPCNAVLTHSGAPTC